jgi:hypothetical protein
MQDPQNLLYVSEIIKRPVILMLKNLPNQSLELRLDQCLKLRLVCKSWNNMFSIILEIEQSNIAPYFGNYLSVLFSKPPEDIMAIKNRIFSYPELFEQIFSESSYIAQLEYLQDGVRYAKSVLNYCRPNFFLTLLKHDGSNYLEKYPEQVKFLYDLNFAIIRGSAEILALRNFDLIEKWNLKLAIEIINNKIEAPFFQSDIYIALNKLKSFLEDRLARQLDAEINIFNPETLVTLCINSIKRSGLFSSNTRRELLNIIPLECAEHFPKPNLKLIPKKPYREYLKKAAENQLRDIAERMHMI